MSSTALPQQQKNSDLLGVGGGSSTFLGVVLVLRPIFSFVETAPRPRRRCARPRRRPRASHQTRASPKLLAAANRELPCPCPSLPRHAKPAVRDGAARRATVSGEGVPCRGGRSAARGYRPAGGPHRTAISTHPCLVSLSVCVRCYCGRPPSLVPPPASTTRECGSTVSSASPSFTRRCSPVHGARAARAAAAMVWARRATTFGYWTPSRRLVRSLCPPHGQKRGHPRMLRRPAPRQRSFRARAPSGRRL